MEPLMTVTDVARYLKVTPRTVYSFLESGTLKGIKIGRSWRVRRRDLERLGHESVSTPYVASQWKDSSAIEARSRFLSEVADLADEEYEGLVRYLSLIRSGRSLRRYKEVFFSSPCPALVIDSSGVVLEANDCASRVFGFDGENPPAVRAWDLPRLSALPAVAELIEGAVQDRVCKSMTFKGSTNDEGDEIQAIWAIPIRSDETVLWICCRMS
jgi:excisionase family DNA binding protein